MAIQNRNYFFTPTVNNERFLSQDEPTEQVMRNFADSVAFKTEVSDTATETQQGLVETATQNEYDNGIDNNANGWALYVRPSMIKAAITAVAAFLQNQITINATNISNNSTSITNIEADIVTIQNEFGEAMPLGSIIMYPIGAIAPNAKWLYCEGQTLDNTVYPEIFALIGYTFGGAGANFSLPDFRKKFVAGFDDSGPAEYQTIGQGAGANDVTLTGAESGMPDHNHGGLTGANGSHSHNVSINKRTDNAGGSSVPTLWQENSDNDGIITITSVPDGEGRVVSTAPDHTHSVAGSGAVAASAAHENRPDFIVFPYIMKVQN